jgi:hypothetical protein
MVRVITLLIVVVGMFGCQDVTKDSAGTLNNPAELSYSVHPNVGGQGTTVDVTMESTRSSFVFGKTGLDLGDGINVISVTVFDGYSAQATVEIASDAALGARDATISLAGSDTVLADGFEVIAESLRIDPDNAKMGELVDVALVGKGTDWEEGYTWASFGDGIDILSFAVLSPSLATATISVRPDATPGFRDVSVQEGTDVLTLFDGFTVDRAALTAFFDPKSAYQGETVEFTITGLDTNFIDGNTVIEFWDDGGWNADIDVTELVVLDSENMYGWVRLSNAAAIGVRDVLIRSQEDVFIPDSFEVLDAPPDLSNVAVGLGFDIGREVDEATGQLLEGVSAFAYFVIPLDPPCGPPPSMGDGPKPYDQNGVFAVPPAPAPVDCPNPETVSAGDYVWFESDANVVTLHKDVISSTGQIIYRGIDLTLDDYQFNQVYDLHTQGDPLGIPEVLLEEVQPTVPADYYLLTPLLYGGYVHAQNEPFNYTWTPAQTYPSAIFSTSISGTLTATGDGGFAGALPWDDGDHTYQPDELLLLDVGPVSFSMVSFVEGRYFGLPFSAIQTCQSDSVLSTSARFTLE